MRSPTAPTRLLFDLATIALGAALTAAFVHIVAILIVPIYASNDAFARLSALGPLNVTIALPQAAPSARLIPFGDPAVAATFCRYDLRNGPLRVTAPAARYEYSSLSFHTSRGGIFYALTDRAATQGQFEALVVTDEQLRAIAARESEDEPSQELRIVSPTIEGFVMMRAFSEAPSLYGVAQTRTGALKCQPEAPQS
jgi:uncharacterized membrane protein